MTERRWDPGTGEWRAFATHRQDRTFLPAADACPPPPTTAPDAPTAAPDAAYPPGVFDNRFPSLSPRPPETSVAASGLYDVTPAIGAAEVVLYTDRHALTFAELDVERVRRLIDVWADRYDVLGARAEIGYVFIFENKGQVIGVTLDHPHGQIYGFPEIPPRPRRELEQAERYFDECGTCVYCDVVAHEQAEGVRIVTSNAHFVAFVPFAARFPYEVQIAPWRHATSLLDLTDPERDAFAEVLLDVTGAYDALFGFSLPYVMAMHQSPTDDGELLHISHLHVEFTPPNRTADKLKYLAGSELAAGSFVNDTVPEDTASALREALSRRAIEATGPKGALQGSSTRSAVATAAIPTACSPRRGGSTSSESTPTTTRGSSCRWRSSSRLWSRSAVVRTARSRVGPRSWVTVDGRPSPRTPRRWRTDGLRMPQVSRGRCASWSACRGSISWWTRMSPSVQGCPPAPRSNAP